MQVCSVVAGKTAPRALGHAFEAIGDGDQDDSYQVLRWSATFVRTLPEDWQFRLVGDGQYTRDSLVSGEQFGIGGPDSVRGFLVRLRADRFGRH